MQGEKGTSNEKVGFQGVARRIVRCPFGKNSRRWSLNHLITISYAGSALLLTEKGAKGQIHPIRLLHRLPRCRNPVNSHVGTQDFRYQNRAIRLLIILNDSNPRAADGEPGTVQSVDEVALAAAFRFEANAGAAGLKRFAVRAGRDLAEFVAGGQPNFEVVRF